MKYSEFFIPTLKDVPSDAEIISHKLMIRSGMIKQASAGIYSWLPLGLLFNASLGWGLSMMAFKNSLDFGPAIANTPH